MKSISHAPCVLMGSRSSMLSEQAKITNDPSQFGGEGASVCLGFHCKLGLIHCTYIKPIALTAMASRRIIERSRRCNFHTPYRISTQLFSSSAFRCDNAAAAAAALSQPTTSPTTTPQKPHTVDPRWLTKIKIRIGKCLMFGLQPAQVDVAGSILQQIARDWRELIAGSEGFLTGEERRSIFRRSVVWGEMVRPMFIALFFNSLMVRRMLW